MVPTPADASPSATAPETPAITPVQDGTPVPSDAGPTGSLVVRQSSVEDLPGVFTEGALAFVEVYDAGGGVVANASNGDYLGSLELLRTDLPPGRYELALGAPSPRSFWSSPDWNISNRMSLPPTNFPSI